MNTKQKVESIRISPDGHLDILSQGEVNKLLDTSQGGLYQLFRKCSLAVLNCGSDTDDVRQLLKDYADFDIKVLQQERGVLKNFCSLYCETLFTPVMKLRIMPALILILQLVQRTRCFTSSETRVC
jgi:hypothetical protein